MASTWKHCGKETKRGVLSKLAAIFDPMGLVSPHTILLKICMQNIWKHGNVDWDDNIPPEIQIEWNLAVQSLFKQDTLHFPRYIGLSNCAHPPELHVFCDASSKAYVACIYARYIQNNNVKVTLIMAKARVAPTKPLTLPRLELMACKFGVTLYRKVLSAMPNVAQTFLYTDSMIALHWINSNPEHLKTFASNRVREIKQHTHPTQWFYIPTASNPADIPSRGLITKKAMQMWANGPEQLQNHQWVPNNLLDLPPLSTEADIEC